jgi:uncharacterized protein (DUF1697 family)
MDTYIALFRGINVGGRNILPMKELVGILQGLGCSNIKTYIQSGNVVFQLAEEKSDNIVEKLSQKILEHYQFEPMVLLIKPTDLDDAVKNNPFNTKDGKALHFFFLGSGSEAPDLEKAAAIKTSSEAFSLIKEVFYLYAPDGIGHSKLAAKVEQILGVPVTARNWNTVNKLMSIVQGL